MINWSKKNWIIILLFIIVVFILIIKFKTSNSIDQNNTKVIPKFTINPTITVILDNKKVINNLTIEEINNLKVEEYEIFIDSLNEEEYNSLPPVKYPIEEYIDYEYNTFKILSFENNQLKVKSKIEDKIESENEFNKWLKSFVEPINFDIIWE